MPRGWLSAMLPHSSLNHTRTTIVPSIRVVRSCMRKFPDSNQSQEYRNWAGRTEQLGYLILNKAILSGGGNKDRCH
ncbi:hypothetical protein BDZ97DRAFT_118348 [Flammula alnicola]|nr:hypothetical protein BDZ97DRAFT_118348 [Flammula alnicola]